MTDDQWKNLMGEGSLAGNYNPEARVWGNFAVRAIVMRAISEHVSKEIKERDVLLKEMLEFHKQATMRTPGSRSWMERVEALLNPKPIVKELKPISKSQERRLAIQVGEES